MALSLLLGSLVAMGHDDPHPCLRLCADGGRVTYAINGVSLSLEDILLRLRRWRQYTSSRRITVIVDGTVAIDTLRHVQSELAGLGITDALIVVEDEMRASSCRVVLLPWPERDIDGEVFDALEARSADSVLRLLEEGAYIEARNSRRQTPLIVAVERRQAEVVHLLIDRGADVEARDSMGRSPLYTAVLTCEPDVVSLLLRAGANVNGRVRNGDTPLIAASGRDRAHAMAVVKALIDSGANVNAASDSGATPIHRAVYIRNRDVIEYLVSKGADVNAKTNDGATVLHHVLGSGAGPESLVRFLLSHGAKLEARDHQGKTPCHYAARSSPHLVSTLLAAGANINARDDLGRTPLHDLVQRGPAVRPGPMEQWVSAALPFSPDLNARDNEGIRPIDIARQGGRDGVVALLLEAGAEE